MVIPERLSNPDVQNAISETVAFYYNDCKEIIIAAETVGGGERPAGLPNEVYSCFHHMARGLCEPKCKDPVKECGEKAISHLKRAAYDSHKIVINAALQDTKRYLEYLNKVLAAPKYRDVLQEDYDAIKKMQQCRDSLEKLYRVAKEKESIADDNTLSAFEAATEKAQELKECYDNLKTKSSIHFMTAAIETEEERLRVKDRWEKAHFIVLWIVSTGALFVSIMSIYLKHN
jgi:hypothetical protein